jgi:hypothetical protein
VCCCLTVIIPADGLLFQALTRLISPRLLTKADKNAIIELVREREHALGEGFCRRLHKEKGGS